VLLAAWGLWLLYVGIANFDPQSEIPRWLAFALSVPLLAVGVWLLALSRSARRKQRAST
jgi:membrane protein DedA with SNARE-associated domain